LSQPVHPVNRLLLDRLVPPRVHHKDVVRHCPAPRQLCP
jgi:hypothetical protein